MSKEKATPVAEAWKHYEWMYGTNVIRVVKWNGGAYLLARDGAPFGSHAGLTKIPIERPIDWPNDCEYWPEVTCPVEPGDVGRIALVDRGDNGIERRKIVYVMRQNGEPIKYVTVGNYGGMEENPVGSSPQNVRVVVSLSELDSQGEGEEAKNREWKPKVGDLVKVTKPSNVNELPRWIEPDMDKFDGQVGRVVEHRPGDRWVRLDLLQRFTFNPNWLSPVEETRGESPVSPMANAFAQADAFSREVMKQAESAAAMQHVSPKAEPPAYVPKVGDWVRITKPKHDHKWDHLMNWLDGRVVLLHEATLTGFSELAVIDPKASRVPAHQQWLIDPAWCSPAEPTQADKDATFWLVDGKVYRLAGMEDAGRKAYLSDLLLHPKGIFDQRRRSIDAFCMTGHALNDGHRFNHGTFEGGNHWWRYAWVPVEPDEPSKQPGAPLTECVAQRDGDCDHEACPQLKDWKPHCPLDRLDTSEECSARGQAFFDPKEVTPEVTGEVEYRDADHRDVGLEVQASQDKQTWDIVPLLAVLPERKKYRFITDHQGVLFAGYNHARVPADPMKDAPRNKIIEGYVRNRWMQIESRGDGWVDCDHWKRVDPVAWRDEVQK